MLARGPHYRNGAYILQNVAQVQSNDIGSQDCVIIDKVIDLDESDNNNTILKRKRLE
jgi:hypothetical protein